MRIRASAVILASLALLCVSTAFAADLDYAPRVHRPIIIAPPPYPPEIYEGPPPRIYSRPVVGFYAYPYDYLEHAPRNAYRPGPQPYMYAEPPGPVDPARYRPYPQPADPGDRGYPAPTYDFR